MSATAQVAALTHRNLLRLRGNPMSLVGAILTPVVFFVGFFVVMRKVLEAQGVDYGQFLPPAIVVQSMIFAAMSSAYFLADDRARGIASRLRAMPLVRGAVLAGRLSADVLRALLSMVVVLTLGFAVGFRFEAGVAAAFAFVLLAVGLALALSLAFGWVALRASQPEAAVQTLSLPYILLFMLSSAFVPADRFPGWLEPIVREQPISRVMEALRALSTGGPTASATVAAAAWVLGIAVVFGVLAVRAQEARP